MDTFKVYSLRQIGNEFNIYPLAQNTLQIIRDKKQSIVLIRDDSNQNIDANANTIRRNGCKKSYCRRIHGKHQWSTIISSFSN